MLKDTIVVITGASSGIGAEMAVLFARHGAVPVLMARSLDKLNETAARISGEKAVIKLDVTSTEQVFLAMEQVLECYGRIDILINNAGFAIFETCIDAPLKHYEEMMEVNYMGLVRCTKAVLPHMLRVGSGHIVNIASIAGKIGSTKASAYSAAKHAVLGFTNCIRQELMGTGVRVTAVNPGPIDTPFFKRADPTGYYYNNVKWFMLKPERVAEEVYDAIVRNKIEKNIPFMANMGVKLFQLFPAVFNKIAHNLLNKK